MEIELEKAIYDSETVSFIRSYLNTLRRETMENNEIIELCQQIYAEHKEALDLIFENRPDRLQNVSEFFKEWCKKQHEKGLIYLDEEKCSKSYIRFRTPFMEEHILKAMVLVVGIQKIIIIMKFVHIAIKMILFHTQYSWYLIPQI